MPHKRGSRANAKSSCDPPSIAGGFSYMKLNYWTSEEREAILKGAKQVSNDDVDEMIQRPILAHLDELMNMRVHAAVYGKGKFNVHGLKDENGDNKPAPEQIIPIKDRLSLANELIKLLLLAQKKTMPDEADDTERLQRELGMQTE